MRQSAQNPHINTAIIPDDTRDAICRSLLTAMRRVQRDQPEVWSRIERRAATLREEERA